MDYISKHYKPLAFIVLALVLALLFSKVTSEQHQITNNVHAQLANRVSNVSAWCNGINDTRNYERQVAAALLARNPGAVSAPKVIANLPCAQLEMQTAKSGNTKK